MAIPRYGASTPSTSTLKRFESTVPFSKITQRSSGCGWLPSFRNRSLAMTRGPSSVTSRCTDIGDGGNATGFLSVAESVVVAKTHEHPTASNTTHLLILDEIFERVGI